MKNTEREQVWQQRVAQWQASGLSQRVYALEQGFPDALAATDIDPALLVQVQALFSQQQAKLAEKDFKITALAHELAYYRRVRFGKASEVLVGEQRLLFDETVDMDLAAIEEEL